MDKIQKAINVFNQGGVVIFPTDTAFGIGCKIDCEKAVRRVYEIRKRPLGQPVPVLVESINMAQRYLEPISDDVKKNLMEKYWPGGLTIVLPCQENKVPSIVRASKKTLGVRMPDDNSILEIIKKLEVPIIAPSANFHGEKTPFRFSDINKNLINLVDFVLEGECKIKEASTVIDCSKKPWKVTRFGAIKLNISKIDIG